MIRTHPTRTHARGVATKYSTANEFHSSCYISSDGSTAPASMYNSPALIRENILNGSAGECADAVKTREASRGRRERGRTPPARKTDRRPGQRLISRRLLVFLRFHLPAAACHDAATLRGFLCRELARLSSREHDWKIIEESS